MARVIILLVPRVRTARSESILEAGVSDIILGGFLGSVVVLDMVGNMLVLGERNGVYITCFSELFTGDYLSRLVFSNYWQRAS